MNPDISPLDPAPTPTPPTSDDAALADILATDPSDPVAAGLLPAPRRPVARWLIGVSAVVVVVALIAVFSTMSPPPSAIPSEPSASTPSNNVTPTPGAKFLKVTILPGDGASSSTVISAGTISEGTVGKNYTYTFNGTGDSSSPITVSVLNGDGAIIGSCPLASGASSAVVTSEGANGPVTNVTTAVTLTFIVNDDGTVTCVGS